MKGIVFREFSEMVESHYSEALFDSLIQQVQPASGGAYTTVGTYDYEELAALVGALSVATNTPAEQLLRTFGRHLADSFSRKFQHFFGNAAHLFDFLHSVESHIHLEVLKLYPDAQLPRFSYEDVEHGVLHLTYRSSRPLEMLAFGLIEGCAEYFGEAIDIATQTDTDTQGRFTRFVISKRA